MVKVTIRFVIVSVLCFLMSSVLVSVQSAGLSEQELQLLVENKLDVSQSQEEFQQRMQLIIEHDGLQTALIAHYAYHTHQGYLPKDWESGVEKFYFYNPSRSPLNFCADINYARSNYAKSTFSSLEPAPSLPKGALCGICPQNAGNEVDERNKKLRELFIDIEGRRYFLHVPPFPYMPMHFVLVDETHTPMYIDQRSISHAMAFVDRMPDYTLCMNSDLLGAGGSIMTHHHFQVFHALQLPVMTAGIDNTLGGSSNGVYAYLVKYPTTVFCLWSENKEAVQKAMLQLVEAWKNRDRKHLSVNYILRKMDQQYIFHVILRDKRLNPTEEFVAYKPEKTGFIDLAGRALLSQISSYELYKDLSDVQKMHGIMTRCLEAMNPVPPDNHYYEVIGQLFSAMNIENFCDDFVVLPSVRDSNTKTCF